jgi:hypothetical protein
MESLFGNPYICAMIFFFILVYHKPKSLMTTALALNYFFVKKICNPKTEPEVINFGNPQTVTAIFWFRVLISEIFPEFE